MPGCEVKRVDGVKQEDAYNGNHAQPIEEIESGGLLVGMIGLEDTLGMAFIPAILARLATARLPLIGRVWVIDDEVPYSAVSTNP
jgi:hypothetical protein